MLAQTVSPSNEQRAGRPERVRKTKQKKHTTTLVVRSPQTVHGDRGRRDHSRKCQSFLDPKQVFFLQGARREIVVITDARFLSNNSVTYEANLVKFETHVQWSIPIRGKIIRFDSIRQFDKTDACTPIVTHRLIKTYDYF